MNRSAVAAFLAVGVLLFGCSDPKGITVGHDFRSFVKEGESTISSLSAEDQKLFRTFAAEYELTYSNPKARTPGVEMEWALGDKTVGQVLEIAKDYYAKKDAALAAKAAEAQAKVAAAESKRLRAEQAAQAEQAAKSAAAGALVARKAEIARPGPKGEPRVFAYGREEDHLVEGETPRYMNNQFRFYLVDVALVQPAESGCARPLVAVKLAVENVHGEPVVGINGKFEFKRMLKKVNPQDPELAQVGTPYRASVIGPFADSKSGGRAAYVTAYLDQTASVVDANYLSQILSVPAAERAVFFAPEKIFYPNGDSYLQESGRSPDQGGNNGLFACGGMGPDSVVHPAWAAALSAAKR